jgi:hypothetical protein
MQLWCPVNVNTDPGQEGGFLAPLIGMATTMSSANGGSGNESGGIAIVACRDGTSQQGGGQ